MNDMRQDDAHAAIIDGVARYYTARVQQLKAHPNAAVRTKAAAVLKGTVNPDRAKVVASYAAALELKGDAAKGKMLYASLGCQGCHTLDGTKSAGPTFKGLAGSQVKLASGETVTADDAYLLESIRDPDKQIVAGYAPGIMSAVIKPGQVSVPDAQDLIAFIKQQK